jgi:hypothetical protein
MFLSSSVQIATRLYPEMGLDFDESRSINKTETIQRYAYSSVGGTFI